jgi:hypothetical protein
MQEEIQALHDNGTWTLVPYQPFYELSWKLIGLYDQTARQW